MKAMFDFPILDLHNFHVGIILLDGMGQVEMMDLLKSWNIAIVS